MKYFKTDGIRGVFGANDLSVELILKVGYSFDAFKEKKIIIGYDPRYSSKIILNTLKYALNIAGKNVVDFGVISTPALMYLSKKMKTIGIMITASHNDFTYNGLKIIYKGRKLGNDMKIMLENRMAIDHKPSIIGTYKKLKLPEKYFHQFDKIKIKRSYKIVFDLANGSMCFLESYLRKRFPNAIIINNNPNGFNINDECGALHPEIARNTMIKNNYDIAVSFDGDGDRAIIILKNGKIINGDLLLYFFAIKLLKRSKKKRKSVVCSEITNRGISNLIEKEGIKVKFVEVGDENLSKVIENNNASIGAEKSGHVILSKRNNYSCGLTTFLSFLSYLDNEMIINLNSLKEYYEVSLNVKKLLSPKRLEYELRKEVPLGFVKVRKSGTENLYRIIIMSPKKDELNNGLSYLNRWINEKN